MLNVELYLEKELVLAKEVSISHISSYSPKVQENLEVPANGYWILSRPTFRTKQLLVNEDSYRLSLVLKQPHTLIDAIEKASVVCEKSFDQYIRDNIDAISDLINFGYLQLLDAPQRFLDVAELTP